MYGVGRFTLSGGRISTRPPAAAIPAIPATQLWLSACPGLRGVLVVGSGADRFICNFRVKFRWEKILENPFNPYSNPFKGP